MRETFPAFSLFLKKGKQITSHLIAYFVIRIHQVASSSSVGAVSVSVFLPFSDSTKDVNIILIWILKCSMNC